MAPASDPTRPVLAGAESEYLGVDHARLFPSASNGATLAPGDGFSKGLVAEAEILCAGAIRGVTEELRSIE